MDIQIKRALLSTYNKEGLIEFAKALSSFGIELISSGGTFAYLRDHDIEVTEISTLTGFPEIMNGRVKTLHPTIHGGILARRGVDDDTLKTHNIQEIDLVVVNLYPFADVISEKPCDFAKAIENIDIGGPTMIRGAAKNHAFVSVVTQPEQYEKLLNQLEAQQGKTSFTFRQELAIAAFENTAAYDAMIHQYLQAQLQASKTDNESASTFPQHFLPTLSLKQGLRYGENPHQTAALYSDFQAKQPNIPNAHLLQGKPLSYNNIADADAALEAILYLDKMACVIVKHANPCGAAIDDDIETAYQKAYSCDKTSAFGGIIAFNRPVTDSLINTIVDQQFVEVILAPSFTPAAVTALNRKPNIRVLAVNNWKVDAIAPTNAIDDDWSCKKVRGGLLLQTKDDGLLNPEDWSVVTDAQPDAKQLEDLRFAWQLVRCVKSNAVVYVKDLMSVGIGAGQMSRIFSTIIAQLKAEDVGLSLQGSVLASDAFFPFPDSIEKAAEMGVSCIIQPGGSIKDPDVIAAANQHGISMIFTGKRHFTH